ncbi:MAG: FKBP-type peptidyl-prolyl cis-trans isomerase [archaeon]|nr:FKBP-type peptidyl-prolyl cis-trans isomerase [archaeon]
MAAVAEQCGSCQKGGAASRCAACQKVRYCGAECQKSDWAYHKNICPALKALDATAFVKVVIKAGDGPHPPKGAKCQMHYEGKLLSGKVFDASRPKARTFDFNVGTGMVIKAWDEGVAQMQKGERAYIVSSPGYAYGSRDVGGGLIPANSVLVFDVELLDFN